MTWPKLSENIGGEWVGWVLSVQYCNNSFTVFTQSVLTRHKQVCGGEISLLTATLWNKKMTYAAYHQLIKKN